MTAEDGIPPAETPSGERTVGGLLRQAREAQSISRDQLAAELKLPLRLLIAIEADDWDAVPPGRGRPLARQIAARLRMDLEHHPDALGILPGARADAPPDPKLERLERGVMAALGVGSIALLAWLLIPGPRLRGLPAAAGTSKVGAMVAPPPPPQATGAYPVLGELLPEAPITQEGTLVSLRAQDVCDAELVAADGSKQTRKLQVSEPWRPRVKGAFTLTLSNAGVVQVEVAGRAVANGAGVGQAWSGHFDENGVWMRPAAPPVPAEPRTQEPVPDPSTEPPSDSSNDPPTEPAPEMKPHTE